MKKYIAFAATATLAVGSSALAQDWNSDMDLVSNIDPFTVTAGEDGPDNWVSYDVIATGDVVGLSLEGTFTNDGVAWSAAEYLRMEIDINGDTVQQTGGSGLNQNSVWHFQDYGEAPGETGTYYHGEGSEVHGHNLDDLPDFTINGLASAGDVITFRFSNGIHSAVNYSMTWDIQTTIHQVPAPGALALLGVAGLSRRRRRN